MRKRQPTSPTPDENLTPEEAQRKQQLEAAKRVVLLTVFLDILGFGIIIPQLGIYAAQFGASPTVVGILASTYSAMGFLFTPFWGRLSDRVGRRPVLLWSILGTTIGYVFFAFAQSLPWLFAARLIDGITGANISTAQAYLSDTTPPEERSKTFGIFGAIFGIGFAIGPFIGAQLSHLPGAWGGNLGIGAFTAALSLINWLLAIKRLPETLTPEMRATNTARQEEQGGGRWQLINVHGFQRAFAIPGLNLVMAIAFFSILAFATMQGTFTLYLITKYVRPEVQTEIRHNPTASAQEAKIRLSQGAGHSTPITTDEGRPAAPTAEAGGKSGDVTPYSPAIGGDFNLPGVAAPAPNLSWRRVEQLLVQPRAARLVNWIFTTIGILAIIVQGGLIRPLKKRVSDVHLILVGTLLMAVALAIVPIPQHFRWQFPVAAMLAIGNGISAPVLTAMVSLLSPEAERGEIIGVFQSTQSLGRIIGPTLGGILFNTVSLSAPYFVGAAIMLVSFVFALGLRGREPEAPPAAS
ncbi:MAG: MFS transporter [Abitibacteriaceae bacterium]|nr:MFS transporter [Abditibacteriaceae bacterium]MBV9868376.1 MFS transporter [Abditibacteriaceae bacterium]